MCVKQISTSSSAEALSDRLRYPSFLRTIPSDIHQTKALAKLMSYFEWEWVGVVHGDDDYGKNALQGFLGNAENENICTAFIEPLPHYLDFKDIDMLIQRLVQTIQNSTAKIVLVILREELVYKLFTEVIKQNISRTWIASDAWSASQNISQMKGIDSIGDVFGLSFITGPIPGFKEYLQNLAIAPGAENRFIEEYQKLGKEKDYLTKIVDITQAFADRLALLSVAHSLRTLLKCDQTACPGNKDFPPFEVSTMWRHVLKSSNFVQMKCFNKKVLLIIFLPASQRTETGQLYSGQSNLLLQCIWKFCEWLPFVELGTK